MAPDPMLVVISSGVHICDFQRFEGKKGSQGIEGGRNEKERLGKDYYW